MHTHMSTVQELLGNAPVNFGGSTPGSSIGSSIGSSRTASKAGRVHDAPGSSWDTSQQTFGSVAGPNGVQFDLIGKAYYERHRDEIRKSNS